MPKELIVSLNGREKKIAIIEDGRVTEFYIERGEGGQGIVGNIYKGRVMRVLPGMQSAFVDIGLERDAFLYVSDFFDEEEEFERIVVDKAKGGDADSARAAAREQLERSRVERERQMETAHERALPEPAEDEEDEGATAEISIAATHDDEETEEIAATLPPPQIAAPSPEAIEEGGGRGRRRRGRGGRRDERDQPGAGQQQGASRSSSAPPSKSFEEDVQSRLATREEIDTPFAVAADSFERVIDEEATAARDEGEMFKDARLQERITDQIHAREFAFDDAATAEVGSLLASEKLSASGGGFERVADDDEGAMGRSQRQTRGVERAVAASVATLEEDVTETSMTASGASQSFERVSDDENAVESVRAKSATGGTAAKKRGASKKSASKGAASKSSSKRAKSSDEEVASSKRAAAKKGAATKKAAGKGASKGRARKGEEGDAEANVSTRSPRGEFARRGGRRRRGGRAGEGAPNGEANGTNGANGHAEEVTEIEVADAPEIFAPDEIEATHVQEEVAQQPREEGGRSSREEVDNRPAREEGGREQRAEGGSGERGRVERGGRPDRGERPDRGGRVERGGRGAGGERDNRSGGSRDNRGGRDTRDARGGAREVGRDNREGGGGRDKREGGREGGQGREGQGGRDSRGDRGGRRGAPTITDLLREGQEVLVQIAKEPISQKGARITSHIALPGRFLVYMPTIEHVGVSRKIESDSERQRLRKLIANIRVTEEVPSGGFIVRTAGTGISEQDLRDDARYLVRTWRDIKRGADKLKAPSMAHKDLDLVQRILRDQLSDDFAAIRVDSEEEYREIVEFVNRIQPRLVNRVKLYTRDEPILEAFGVQAEIDKAIKPRVWLRSGGYLVINQTEALVAIDVNTGKFVGRGGSRLEDTITKTNLEAVDEIARQIRLRDLGGIIVLDLIDMEDRRNRNRVMGALQDALRDDKSPTKVLSFNDFGLVIMTRKRVKQSLERTLCSPCPYCTGAGLVKSPQTVCYEILEEARSLARAMKDDEIKQATLRVNPEVSRALLSTERDVLAEIEDYLGAVDLTGDERVHQEQFDFALV
jgi:ribonuclease G